VADPPAGWTPTGAHAVAAAWSPVTKAILVHGGADAVTALKPVAPTDGWPDGTGLFLRVVDDRGEGVPGAVLTVHGPAIGDRDDFTTGAEGLVPRAFAERGRYDVSLKSAPDGWLARSAGFESERNYAPSVAIVLDAAGEEPVVELRVAIARAARLELEVPAVSSLPRNRRPFACVGIQRGDGSLLAEWNGEWSGDRATWKSLPSGAAYVFVNVPDVGTAGSWCQLAASATTRARLDPETDGTSLTVRVPTAGVTADYVAVSVRQIVSEVGPVVWRVADFVPLGSSGEALVEFRNLRAGRYVVGASFHESTSLPPALVELQRGENRLEMLPARADVDVADVPVVWAQNAVGGWEWPRRPQLIDLEPESGPGPRFAPFVPDSDTNGPTYRAIRGPSVVLALHPPGSWYANGSNHRFLPLDLPAARTFEPDRP
jgi:hypothetical protein